MRLLLSIYLILSIHYSINAQTAWTWEELANMPEKVANNAVAYGEDGTNRYVYSFGGIDTTKLYSGINKGAYRYTIDTDTWETIHTLPFLRTNIASGASTVKNKIYIIGGYHVFSSGGEISSDEVLIYNPETNAYETNGEEIPVPIDDHVQCVWNDSLIYVVTGWSNTGNVPDVQIYDPQLDNWLTGTPTPNNNDYKAFGASGEIIGDTIYYCGGASMGGSFPARNLLRKGIINPANPTDITWSIEQEAPTTLYRSAALTYGNNIFWLGGSATSYNYNGIAYNGSGGVPPLNHIMRYDHSLDNWYLGDGAPYAVMDLRGIAQISPTQWIVCGGMEADQEVSNKTYLVTYDPITGGLNETEELKQRVSIINHIVTTTQPALEIKLIDLSGKIIRNLPLENPNIADFTGTAILQVVFKDGNVTKKIVR